MVDVIDVALVVVAHLVPLDDEMLPASEGQIRRQGRVIVDGQGKCPHVLVEDLLNLRVKSEERRVKDKEADDDASKDASLALGRVVFALQHRQLPMELDGQYANEDDAERAQQGTYLDAEPHVQANNVCYASGYAGKGIDFASEDKGHVVHQDIADDAASCSGDSSHRNGDPEGMPQGKCLLYAYHIEEGQSDGVEDEPGVVMVNDVLAEHADCQHSEGAADEVAAVCHPERIEPQHEVTNRSAANSCRHADNPSSEDVEVLGTGQAYT